MSVRNEETLQHIYEILGRHGAFDQGVEIGAEKWLEIFCAQAQRNRSEAQRLGSENTRLSSENRALRFQVQRHQATLEELAHFQLGLLMLKAFEIFNAPEAALSWFLRGSSVMGGRRPVDALETLSGREEVMRALTHTERGAVAAAR